MNDRTEASETFLPIEPCDDAVRLRELPMPKDCGDDEVAAEEDFRVAREGWPHVASADVWCRDFAAMGFTDLGTYRIPELKAYVALFWHSGDRIGGAVYMTRFGATAEVRLG